MYLRTVLRTYVFNIVNFTGYALIYYFLLQSRLSRKVILLLIAGAVLFLFSNTIFSAELMVELLPISC